MDRAKAFQVSLLLVLATQVAGCGIVEGIFKAGMWVGILLVLLVVGVIFWIVNRSRS